MVSTVRHRSWAVAFTYERLDMFLSEAAANNPTEPTSTLLWITVEALWSISPMQPHGLLVASFSPGGAAEIGGSNTGEFDLSEIGSVGLLGRHLKTGLPTELGQAAITGARAASLTSPLRAGRLTLVGGGLDVDSAEFVFEKLGQLTVVALSARMRGIDEPSAIHTAVAAW